MSSEPCHSLIVWLHQFVSQDSIHESFIGSGMAPRLKIHLLRHASSKARGPTFARVFGYNLLNRFCSDEMRITAYVVCDDEG